MTLYQKINQMGTKYGNDSQLKNQSAAQNEVEDLIYEFFTYALVNGKIFGTRIEENRGTNEDLYMELILPYKKTDITLTVDTGRCFIVKNEIEDKIISNEALYISIYTSNFGGFVMHDRYAYDTMHNLHKRISENVELNAFLLLQGINIDKLFMINRPYKEPTAKKVDNTFRGGIFVTF